MNHFKIVLFLLLAWKCSCEEFSSGADYLQTAIRDIAVKNSERNIIGLIDNQARIATPPTARRIISPIKAHFDGHRRFSGGDQSYHNPPDHHPEASDSLTAPSAPPVHAVPHPHHIPEPPSLTKGELAALYEAAVSAGHGINLDGLHEGGHDNIPVQAAVHEIRDTTGYHHHHGGHGSQGNLGNEAEGYYYYYYPLKSFMDVKHAVPKDHYKAPVLTSYNTHLHNVKVEPIRTVTAVTEPPGKGGKALEPLFMAISSFVGMAVMVVVSMVFWPRLSGGIKKVFKRPGPKSKNNFKNGPNLKNNPNKKKKARIIEDWPKTIADFVDVNCRGCDKNLGPYRFWLNRNVTRSSGK